MIYPGIVRSRFEEALQGVNGFSVYERQKAEASAGQGKDLVWVEGVSAEFMALGGESGAAPGGASIGNMPAVSQSEVSVMAAFTVERARGGVDLDENIRNIRSAMRQAADRLHREGVILRWTWVDTTVAFGTEENPDRHAATFTMLLEDK